MTTAPKVSGNAGEAVIDRLFHAAARAAFVADLWFVPTPTEWVRGKLKYTRKSVCDFVGILLDGSGRMVAEEVKFTEDDVLTLSVIKPHQRGFLDRTQAAGGVALLSIVTPQGVWSFRWVDVRTRKSITMRAHMDASVTPASYVALLRRLSVGGSNPAARSQSPLPCQLGEPTQ